MKRNAIKLNGGENTVKELELVTTTRCLILGEIPKVVGNRKLYRAFTEDFVAACKANLQRLHTCWSTCWRLNSVTNFFIALEQSILRIVRVTNSAETFSGHDFIQGG